MASIPTSTTSTPTSATTLLPRSTPLISQSNNKIVSPCSSRSYATPSSPILTPSLTFNSSWEPTTLPELGESLPFDTFTGKLEQSPADDRQYRYIRLPNGLEAMLIRDEKTDKSSAAMDVKVGHLMDPPDLKGCAHFCEHLLFLGTEKFPKENEYAEYLAQAGGYSNAYTGMDQTNYYFSVSPSSLSGALERFAQFFTSPLFDASCTERELRAVDSEHSKNLQSDMWRLFQLEKSLSRPDHPYSKFGTGNWQTLWEDVKARGGEPREELLRWWKSMYSANRMKLVVLGKEPLDELTKWAVELFSAVPDKGLDPVVTFEANPFGPEIEGSTTFMKTVKDLHSLELCWVVPDQSALFKTKPASFIAHYLGHEGPGSVLSYLKKKGWVNGLGAGNSDAATGFSFFRVNCDLTPEGYENYDQVALAIFTYLDLLYRSGPQPGAYTEVSSLAALSFQFVEKSSSPSDDASELAVQLSAPYPKEWVLSQPYLMRAFDETLVRETLDVLVDVGKCKMVLAGKKLPAEVEKKVGTWDRKEAIYGTEFRVDKFGEEFVRAASRPAPISDLHLPVPNEFIPEDLNVDKIENITPKDVPALLKETELSQLWYKKDDRFWVPRANFWVGLQSPKLDASPIAAASARLFTELFRDHMTEALYPADLAGLKASCMYSGGTIVLSCMGYNDRLPVLMKTVLEELKAFKVDPKRFELLKDDLKRDWSNHELGEPYGLSHYFGYYLIEDKMYSPKEKIAIFDQITVESVEKFIAEALSRVHVQTLVHGNLSKESAIELQEVLETILKPTPLTAEEKINDAAFILPESSSHVWQLDLPNKENPNSGVDYYLQIGSTRETRLRAIASLFSQIAREPCFDTLRTKEQLGYLVSSGGRNQSGTIGWHILVQSQNDSVYLENRIEAFLSSLASHLESLPAEDFERQKKSLIEDKLQSLKNLYEESARLWGSIQDGFFDFKKREKDVAELKTVTQAELLDFYQTYINPASQTRRKASVHLRTQIPASEVITAPAEAETPFVAEKEAVEKKEIGVLDERNVLIEDVHVWKKSLKKSEPARPVQPLETFKDQL
ncbi:related to ste23-metalloprotease involved in a-factor processing [Phaffia rhodozyma]|uniref:Related to ste23-metalloprotease involved in a-factor processing n=1 Tax=Phaffia rhodozyma TaxID=264483 RepID=A0A0F7SHE7_PHARH|nr:related to ste23-metalloprotease involved in a-factor processing [Phaffia rhodozyma]